jgi:hypothetical protein
MKRKAFDSTFTKRLENDYIEEICNSSKNMRTRGLWVGDFIGFACYYCLGASGNRFILIREGVKILLKLLWNIPPANVLAFRSATTEETRKSRCNSNSLITWRDWRMNKSHHMVVLVRRPVDLQLTELMISTAVDSLEWVECVDLRRVDFIRFMLWISLTVRSMYDMEDAFVSVWCENVVPLLCADDGFFMKLPSLSRSASILS